MRRLLLLALAAACGQTQSNLTPTTLSRLGVYRFLERVPSNPPVVLEGEISLRSDSILFAAQPGPCRYDGPNSNGRVLSYTCAGVTYSFDRNDPVEGLTYSFTVVETVPGPRCRVGTPDQPCIAGRSQPVDRPVTHSGRLRPKRVS
jgi:hypothetical protein